MKVEKFPRLILRGRELQWDTRQEVTNPLVVVRKDTPPEALGELLRISRYTLTEGKDFSDWGSLVAETLGDPSEKLKIVGIVGTNGKTTTAALLRFLLVAAGRRVLELGTLGAQLWAANENDLPLWHEVTGFTSPEAHTFQSLLAQAIDEKVDFVVTEVTSHAIALGRIDGTEFDGAIFLNFSQDHLDFHKTLAEYKRVKKSFFLDFLPRQKNKKTPAIVVNANDAVGAELESALRAPAKFLARGRGYTVDTGALELKINFEGKEFLIPIVGDFQAENILSAAYLAESLTGTPIALHLEVFKSFKGVPGRMEIANLTFGNRKRKMIVDFAHTPEALRKNLDTLFSRPRAGKLWVLFGCGGDRDPLKRPIMGEIAAKYSDRVVVTSDNPRSEDPEKIIDAIVEPLVRAKHPFVRIADRKTAMKYCLENMHDDDVCLVAGRGHEAFQLIGDAKVPFKDIEVLKSLCC